MFFLRKTKSTEPLPIVMCGVRMGERVLQIGIDDPSLAGQFVEVTIREAYPNSLLGEL